MKNKKLFILMATILILCFSSFSVQAAIFGDVNSDNTVDLSDVQDTLKMYLGLQSTNATADVNSDGSVDLEDVQILLKLYLGIEIDIARKNPDYQSFDSQNKLSYSTYKTNKGVVCIVQNNSQYALKVDATCVFYRLNKMVDSTDDYNYCLEPNGECVFEFTSYDTTTYSYIKFDDYKVTFKAEKGSNLVYGANAITVKSDSSGAKVTAEFTNNSGVDLYTIVATAVFYDSNDNVIGTEYHYIDCTKAGSTDYKTFDYPYDTKTYDTIIPSSYRIFVDSAYIYTWMQ